MGGRDLVSVGSWVAIGVICWIIAWIIAEGIPSFENLLSLISALFASWFSCTFPHYLMGAKLPDILTYLQLVSVVFTGCISTGVATFPRRARLP